MSASVWAALFAAVTLFWCVGLYNRLTRLRAQALVCLDAVQANLQSYTSLIDAQFPAEEGSFIPMEWAELVSCVKALSAHCEAVRAAPMAIDPLRALGQAENAIEQAWAQLREQPADLAGPTMPEAMQKLWDEAAWKARAARSAFNQAVDRYNEALHQFPANTVAGFMGFKQAGNL